MSIEIMRDVWKHSKHKGNELLCLLALSDNANDNGAAWIGIETIRTKTRVSRRYVFELLEKLYTSREVIPFNRMSDSGTMTSNLYIVVTGCSPETANERIKKAQEEIRGIVKWSSNEPEQKCTTLVNPSALPSEPQCTTLVNPSAPESSIESSMKREKADTSWIFEHYLSVFMEPVPSGDHDLLGEIAEVFARADIIEAMQITKRADARQRKSRKVPYMLHILQDWAANGKPEIKPSNGSRSGKQEGTPIRPRKVYR